MTASDPSVSLAKMIDLVTPFAVRTAVTLRLPQLMASGATSLADLAAESGADPDALRRLLRHLVSVGFFAEPSPGTYDTTEASGELLGDGEDKQWFRAWLDLEGPGTRMDLAFSGMAHSIRTGQPGYATVHGQSFWDDVADVPELSDFFNGVMTAYTWQTVPTLIKDYDWSTVRSVVDVGGGTGGVLAALLQAYPHLRGTLVDLPTAVPGAESTFADAGVTEQAESVGGSFLDPLPAGGDVYLVSRVLTDWDDDGARTILRRCAEAAGPSGRVLIVEVLPGAEHAKNNSSFDLHMLVLLGGKERTVADFIALAAEAGLAVSGIRTWEDGLLFVECGAHEEQVGGRGERPAVTPG